jgi:hypothetical protein
VLSRASGGDRLIQCPLGARYSRSAFGSADPACGDRPVDIPELPIGQAALETNLCQVTVALADFRLDEIGQLEGRLVAELTDPSRK